MSRLSATSYARNLEQQVADLQGQLQALANSAVPSSAASSHEPQQSHFDLLVHPGDDLVLQQTSGMKVYRFSAALNVIQRIADMIGGQSNAHTSLVEIWDTRADCKTQTHLDWLNALLPDRDIIRSRVSRAIDVGMIGYDCIDQATLQSRLALMLDQVGSLRIQQQKPLLAVLYALLALEELHSGILRQPQAGDVEARRIHGLSYFQASRSIVLEETGQCDLDTITALFLQSRYLLSASTFTDAHAVLASAITMAMQMGLHLDDAPLQGLLSETELYNRRRLIAGINAFETVISFSLGLPRTLRTIDAKQTLGLHREDLPDRGRDMLRRDATTCEAETVFVQKLVSIYAKVLDKQFEQMVEAFPPLDWMADIEGELKAWESGLPSLAQTFATPRILHGQLILRLNYTGVYMNFTAPCLHHLSRKRTDPDWNLTGFEYASSCIRAASESVYLMRTLQANGFLDNVLWLNNYLLAWAAIVLSYFVVNSGTRITIVESKEAALVASEILEKLGETNTVARRIHECIAPSIDLVLAASPDDASDSTQS